MSKIIKIPKSAAESIAEMELEKLYQKSLGSELSLEDTKKYDILVKSLRESQKESSKELEAKFFQLKQQLLASLPTEALAEYAGQNPGEKDDTKAREEVVTDSSDEYDG